MVAAHNPEAAEQALAGDPVEGEEENADMGSCNTCSFLVYDGDTLEEPGAGDVCTVEKNNPLPLMGQYPDNCPTWIAKEPTDD